MAFVYDNKTRSAINSETGFSVEGGTNASLEFGDSWDGRRSCRLVYDNIRMILSVVDRNIRVKRLSPRTGKESLARLPRATYVIENEIEDGLRMISRRSRVSIENLKSMIIEGLYVYTTRVGTDLSLLKFVPDYEVRFVKNKLELPPENHFMSSQ